MALAWYTILNSLRSKYLERQPLKRLFAFPKAEKILCQIFCSWKQPEQWKEQSSGYTSVWTDSEQPTLSDPFRNVCVIRPITTAEYEPASTSWSRDGCGRPHPECPGHLTDHRITAHSTTKGSSPDCATTVVLLLSANTHATTDWLLPGAAD